MLEIVCHPRSQRGLLNTIVFKNQMYFYQTSAYELISVGVLNQKKLLCETFLAIRIHFFLYLLCSFFSSLHGF